MEFIIKLFDTPLLMFSADPQASDPDYSISWINEDTRDLLPLDLDPTSDGIAYWVERRVIPRNRAFVHAFLAKCGLSSNRPLGIVAVCKGLSLNDSYWVAPRESDVTFDAVNLYENNMSRILANIAFTGYGSRERSEFASSPEFTTGGMLPKCWRRMSGKIYLYKGGTSGAANTGFEPYSEFYATQVAHTLEANAVSYELSKWKGEFCSRCELFTSKEISYMPVGRIVRRGGFEAVLAQYRSFGDKFYEAFCEMLALDALLFNIDRHFGNFGVLVSSRDNKIIAPAPLFDHGNSLFNFAMGNDWDDEASIEAYADTQVPRIYDGFVETAKQHLTGDLRRRVRHLLDFEFTGKTRYPLPRKRQELMASQVRRQARLLLG